MTIYSMPLVFYDALMVGLFIIGVVYCLWFFRKLKKSHKQHDKLENILRRFEESAKEGEAKLNDLQEVIKTHTASWKTSLEKAECLREDLRYFSERGDELLTELDERFKIARSKMQESEKNEEYASSATHQDVLLKNIRPSLVRTGT